MKFIQTDIPDVFIMEPTVFGDHRGYFFESFRQNEFEKHAPQTSFVQENESKSSYGVLRGLHYQQPPYAQAKLVRVLQGKVLDVAVDIRKHSKTFGHHVAIELSGENKRQLFIPQGFAHGFVTLSDEAVFSYKCDNYFNKESEASILFNDKDLNIDWQLPEASMLLSDKDINATPFRNAILFDL
jgi:dTDP-4-dehydrorhamnose 3,5-epimerase